MKTFEFDYTKKNLDKSHREVFILQEKDNYMDVLDCGYLDEYEIEAVSALFKKAFRRFSKDGIENLQEMKDESE